MCVIELRRLCQEHAKPKKCSVRDIYKLYLAEFQCANATNEEDERQRCV